MRDRVFYIYQDIGINTFIDIGVRNDRQFEKENKFYYGKRAMKMLYS